MPKSVPVYDCDQQLIGRFTPAELVSGGWLEGDDVRVIRTVRGSIRRVHLYARLKQHLVDLDLFEGGSGVRPGQKYAHWVTIADGTRSFWQLRSVRSLGAAVYYESVLSGVTRQ